MSVGWMVIVLLISGLIVSTIAWVHEEWYYGKIADKKPKPNLTPMKVTIGLGLVYVVFIVGLVLTNMWGVL